MEKIYIVGAHFRAQTLRAYLEYLNLGTEVEVCLVANLSENKPMIGWLRVGYDIRLAARWLEALYERGK